LVVPPQVSRPKKPTPELPVLHQPQKSSGPPAGSSMLSLSTALKLHPR